MNRVGIFGASGMAREVGDIVWTLGMEPIYIARDSKEIEHWTLPEDVIPESEVGALADIGFVIGIGEPCIRENIANRHGSSLRFTNIIHPSATFGRGQRDAVERGRGIVVSAGARLTNGIAVGDFSIINQNACIAHDVVMEAFVHVSPGACVSGNVYLGKGCWIGAGAVVNQGENDRKLLVGSRTMIGSGAVVTGDCEADAVYAGVPARRLK